MPRVRNPDIQLPVCARPGCNKQITPVAKREQDPYCSSACCRQHLQVPGWENIMDSQRRVDKQWKRKSQDSRYAA